MLEQSTMTPGTKRGRVLDKDLPGVYRGKILPNGISYKDNNGAKQTLVDLYMYDLLPVLNGVPLMAQKINKNTGNYEDPEPDDLVVVAFFGDIRNPIILGFLPSADNEIQSAATEAPRSHRKRNGTWETIDKVGNLIRKVVGYVSDTIDGNRTTIIEGNEETTVTSGDLTITVSAGKCTVDIAGKTAWTSAGIDLIGGPGAAGGGVQSECICSFTRKPHAMVSSTVKFTL